MKKLKINTVDNKASSEEDPPKNHDLHSMFKSIAFDLAKPDHGGKDDNGSPSPSSRSQGPSEVDRETRKKDVLDLTTTGKIKVLAAHSRKKAHKNQRLWVIKPNSLHKLHWDIFISVIIIYGVINIPYRLAFQESASGVWYSIEGVMDVLFGIDMLLSFNTAFYRDEKLVTSRPKIAINYARTWFLLDLISTFPFDRIAEAFLTSSSRNLRSLKLFKVLRLIRIAKLLQLLRLRRQLNESDNFSHTFMAITQMIGLLSRILLVAHLLACGWFAINECERIDSDAEVTHEMWVKCGGSGVMSMYLSSLYWTISTMMAIGYGDVQADTIAERLYALITQIVGAAAFGFIIRNVASILESSNPQTLAKKARMKELTQYMIERRLPSSLQRRLREHFEYYYNFRTVFDEDLILRRLTKSLRSRLILNQARELSKSIWFLDELSKWHSEFLTNMLPHLMPMSSSPGDIITVQGDFASDIYFVVRGRIDALRSDRDFVDVKSSGKDGNRKPKATISPSRQRSFKKLLSGREYRQKHQSLRYGYHDVLTDENRKRSALIAIYTDGQEFEMHTTYYGLTTFATYVTHAVSDLIYITREHLMEVMIGFPETRFLISLRAGRSKSMHNEVANAFSTDVGLTYRVSQKIIYQSEVKKYQELTHILNDRSKVSSKSGRYTDRDRRKNESIRVLKEQVQISEWVEDGKNIPIQIATYVEDEIPISELRSRFIVYPYDRWKIMWDSVIFLCILYTVIAIPFRIGYYIESNLLYKVELAVDVLFLCDIFLTFRCAYQLHNRVFVAIPRLITRHYFSTWFIIDFASILPFEYIAQWYESESSYLQGIQVIRIFRLFRLLKLLRATKLNSLKAFQSYAASINAYIGQTIQLLVVLFMLGHVFGCLFSFVSIETASDDTVSWWEADGLTEDQIIERYVASLYWSITTMTTVGYGDLVPGTESERLYVLLIIICGATIFGYIVGVVSQLRYDALGALEAGQDEIVKVKYYLSEQNVDYATQESIRKHFRFVLSKHSAFDEEEILNRLPKNLRRETIYYSHRNVIGHIPIFRGRQREFVTDVMPKMKPCFILATQFIYTPVQGSDGIYFLLDGIAEEVEMIDKSDEYITRNIVEPGGMLGHRRFLESRAGGTFIGARAFTDCNMYLLSGDDMQKLFQSHPKLAETLKDVLTSAIKHQQKVDEEKDRRHRKIFNISSIIQGISSHRQDIPQGRTAQVKDVIAQMRQFNTKYDKGDDILSRDEDAGYKEKKYSSKKRSRIQPENVDGESTNDEDVDSVDKFEDEEGIGDGLRPRIALDAVKRMSSKDSLTVSNHIENDATYHSRKGFEAFAKPLNPSNSEVSSTHSSWQTNRLNNGDPRSGRSKPSSASYKNSSHDERQNITSPSKASKAGGNNNSDRYSYSDSARNRDSNSDSDSDSDLIF